MLLRYIFSLSLALDIRSSCFTRQCSAPLMGCSTLNLSLLISHSAYSAGSPVVSSSPAVCRVGSEARIAGLVLCHAVPVPEPYFLSMGVPSS